MSFASQVGKWASESKDRMTAVRQRSVELLGEEMAKTKPQGGRVPFLTGNLARSLLASTAGMPKTATGLYSGSNVGLVAATLKIDQPVWLGYQATYARKINFGHIGPDKLGRVYNQQGNHFVEGAIAMWPQIVKEAVEEVKANG